METPGYVRRGACASVVVGMRGAGIFEWAGADEGSSSAAYALGVSLLLEGELKASALDTAAERIDSPSVQRLVDHIRERDIRAIE